MLRLFDFDGNCTREFLQDQVTLGMTFHPRNADVVLVTGMGGYTRLIHLDQGQIIQEWRDHSKYVVACAFSADGSYFVTGSHDKTVLIYHRQSDSDTYIKAHTLFFGGAVESLCILPSTQILVISARNDHNLYTVELVAPFTHVARNMNSNGDGWVSFAALHLSASLDGRYLLVLTDTPSGRFILYDTQHWKKIQDIWGGLKIDRFSNPKGIWLDSENFVVGDDEGYLTLWNIHLPLEQGRLQPHSGAIRGLSRAGRSLCTGSFDKSLCLWDLHSIVNR